MMTSPRSNFIDQLETERRLFNKLFPKININDMKGLTEYGKKYVSQQCSVDKTLQNIDFINRLMKEVVLMLDRFINMLIKLHYNISNKKDRQISFPWNIKMLDIIKKQYPKVFVNDLNRIIILIWQSDPESKIKWYANRYHRKLDETKHIEKEKIIKPINETPIDIGGGWTISDIQLFITTVQEKTSNGDDAYKLISIAHENIKNFFDYMDKL